MKRLIFFLIFLLSISLSYAIPAIPIQIYGSLDKDIPDGAEISFIVDGEVIGTGSVNGNKYGYDSVLFIDYVDSGVKIKIFIEEVLVEEVVFQGDNTVKEDIQISEQEQERINQAMNQNSGSDEDPPVVCVPVWECSDWSECSIAGKRRITCIDLKCGSDNRITEENCEYTAPDDNLIGEAGETRDQIRERILSQGDTSSEDLYWVFYLIGIIIILVVLGGIGFVFLRKKKKLGKKVFGKKKDSSKKSLFNRGGIFAKRKKAGKKNLFESEKSIRLNRYIKHTLEMGYKKEQIRKALLHEGWKKEMIDEAFKKVK